MAPTVFIIVLLSCVVFLSSSVIIHEDCKQYIDELWPLQPRGEGQLNAILNGEIRKKWSTDKHYPTREEIIKILYHSDTSPYHDLKVVERIESTEYVSFAQKSADRLQQYTLKHFGGEAP